MNIAEYCIKKPTVTLTLAAVMLVAGVLAYFRLGRLEDAEFTIKMAQVITYYPGAPAEDVANRAAAHGIITPENVRPVSKNPIIAAFFKEIRRADELGSGTRNLYHYTRLYSGADPIIDEEDAFSVTVPLNDGYSPEVGRGMQGNDIKKASVGSDTVNGTANDTASGPLSGLKRWPVKWPVKRQGHEFDCRDYRSQPQGLGPSHRGFRTDNDAESFRA